MLVLNCFEIIKENGAFAQNEQMLHLLQCFQPSSVKEALKCDSVEERVNWSMCYTEVLSPMMHP